MKRKLSIDTSRSAALFVDLQEEHRQDQRYLVAGYDAVLANVQLLQCTARQVGIPVIHSAYVVDDAPENLRRFHPVMADGTSAFSQRGSPLTAICSEVGPVGTETVLIKTEASAFGTGALADHLRAMGTEWLFVSGVWTEACIDLTVRQAVDLGFRVLLVKDACGSGSRAMHETAILNLANRLYGGAVVSAGSAAALMAGETAEAWMVEGSVPLRFTYDDAAALYGNL